MDTTDHVIDEIYKDIIGQIVKRKLKKNDIKKQLVCHKFIINWHSFPDENI